MDVLWRPFFDGGRGKWFWDDELELLTVNGGQLRKKLMEDEIEGYG
ncbi:hypothetical protein ACFCT7_10210 [Fulvivirgaceae bacterium LMO-SS25]